MAAALNDTFLPSNATISEVMECLNRTGTRIALIVDDKNRLLGTITDGDLRRSLTGLKDQQVRAAEIMNKDPVSVKSDVDNISIKKIMIEKGLLSIPVVDQSGRVIGLEHLSLADRKVHKKPTVLIQAGGFGKRLGSLTKDIPKPLLPVGGKPLLYRIIQSLVDQGFDNILISVHYKGALIKKRLGNGSKFGCSIAYLDEVIPLGTAGSLANLPDDTTDQILVCNADILTLVNFDEMLKYHVSMKSDLTIGAHEYQTQIPFGVLDVEDGLVTALKEKPTMVSLTASGIYMVDRQVINSLEKNVYLDMPKLITKLINEEKRITYFHIFEYWIDIGVKSEFEKANLDWESLPVED